MVPTLPSHDVNCLTPPSVGTGAGSYPAYPATAGQGTFRSTLATVVSRHPIRPAERNRKVPLKKP